MRAMIYRVFKSTIVCATIAILVFGVSHFGVLGHVNDQMTNCPFIPGHSSVCNMSPVEHVLSLQSMFTVLPVKDVMSQFSALITLLVLLSTYFIRKYYPPLVLQTAGYSKGVSRRFISIPNSLTEAFSKGILNPKPH